MRKRSTARCELLLLALGAFAPIAVGVLVQVGRMGKMRSGNCPYCEVVEVYRRIGVVCLAADEIYAGE